MLVSCLRNRLSFAGGNLAILQGASAVPISAAISAKRATPENRLSVPARRVALKMGWRRRCGSVAAPLRGCVLAAPCRHPILNATNDKLVRRQDTNLDIRPPRFAMRELERLGLFQNMTGYDQ